MNEEDKNAMREKEEFILNKLNIKREIWKDDIKWKINIQKY